MTARKSIRVEMSEKLHGQARMKSAATGKTLTEICREALQEWVDEESAAVLPQPEKDTSH